MKNEMVQKPEQKVKGIVFSASFSISLEMIINIMVTKIIIIQFYDREGELIGVEALNIIRQVNPKVPFDRVRYSAITPKAIELYLGLKL